MLSTQGRPDDVNLHRLTGCMLCMQRWEMRDFPPPRALLTWCMTRFLLHLGNKHRKNNEATRDQPSESPLQLLHQSILGKPKGCTKCIATRSLDQVSERVARAQQLSRCSLKTFVLLNMRSGAHSSGCIPLLRARHQTLQTSILSNLPSRLQVSDTQPRCRGHQDGASKLTDT